LVAAWATLLWCGLGLGGNASAQDRTYGNATDVDQDGTPVATSWIGTGARLYTDGTMHMARRDGRGGASLFNMDLIENDGPGSGFSEKGVWFDDIWGDRRARKILTLDDARTEKAWLVLYAVRTGNRPLHFTINGHEAAMKAKPPVPPETNPRAFVWTEFPAAWLKQGDNVIELSCPEITKEAEGWAIQLSRADEFADGGGNPEAVGRTSFGSDDGGRTWRQSPFGPQHDVRAEYTVRLSLDRYVKTGWVASPVIDLWREDGRKDPITPQRELHQVTFAIQADVPDGTSVQYFLRRGTSTNPWSPHWEPYALIGNGAVLNHVISTDVPGPVQRFRYVQLRAVLSTTNPLQTPVIRDVQVHAGLKQLIPRHPNIYVVSSWNPTIKYSSIDWRWESSDRPEFAQLREQENLDEVVAGSRTEFDAQVKLMGYVMRRWTHDQPEPGYPAWDALTIFDRIAWHGGGGQCAQVNNALAGVLMAYGWQARLVNVIGHEPVEVWNDEFAKWVFLDADYENNYNYDPESGEPLNLHELHQLSHDYYRSDRSIDWMKDNFTWESAIPGKPIPVRRGSLTWQPDTQYATGGAPTGFANAADVRMVPRNNWYAHPTPRPLNHGSGSQMPWTGYITWYDAHTPPKRQYSWFTDKPADMWPDLNLVHVDLTQGFGNDRLFLRFDTYTPNFSHFEIDVDDTGWRKAGSRWTWLLQSGRNTLRVRAVSKLKAHGHPSCFVINHADAQFPQISPPSR